MRHSDNKLVTELSEKRPCLELSVCQLIEFDVSVVIIETGNSAALIDLHIEDEEETAACLVDSSWLTSRKNDKLLLEEECTFDMEVLDIKIKFGKPLPLIGRVCRLNVAIVDGRVHLEAIAFKIDLNGKSDGLELLVLQRNLLCDCVQVGKDTCLRPAVAVQVVAMAALLFVTSDEE